MPMETRSSASAHKRVEQLKRWETSETNKISSEISKDKLRKIQFSKGCIFLACCAAGDFDEVEQLLKLGVDINTSNVDGLTALHQACIDNNLEMVEFLVSHGCDVNCSDYEGWTPLHAAASCGLDSVVKYLIDHGGDVAAVNNEGALPIDITDTPEVAALLQEEMDKRGVDLDAARQMEERQMKEDLQRHLAHGGDFIHLVHPRTGATALHVAAAKGYLELIRQLLEAGADPNRQDLDGWTPLHAAAHWGQKEACELLALASPVDMTFKNYVGQTCFDLADEELADFLQDLQKRQVSARLEANERQREAILQQTARPTFVPPPLKRRTSVNRMSVADKTSVILKATIAERALFADAEETIAAGEEADLPSSHEATPSPPAEIIAAPLQETPPPPAKEPAETCKPLQDDQVSSQAENMDIELSLPPTPPDNRPKKEEPPSHGRRSLVPSNREESSEAQRKAHAKRVRETRRSTQGVTLEDVKSAEQQLLLKRKLEAGGDQAASTPTQEPAEDKPVVRVRPKQLSEEEKNAEDAGKSGDQVRSAVTRRRRPKRRSTGVALIETGEEEKTAEDSAKEGKEEEDSPEENVTTSTNSSAPRPERRNYKKLYEETKEENHKLQERLRRVESQLEEVRNQLRHNLKNNQVNSLTETDKKKEKRTLERKISELEEEVKEVEKLRKANDKLKMENGALVRVVSRLSLPPNQKVYS